MVELSKRRTTVRQVYRQPRELRIAWGGVDHFADVYRDSGLRQLVAVLTGAADTGPAHPTTPEPRPITSKHGTGAPAAAIADHCVSRPTSNRYRIPVRNPCRGPVWEVQVVGTSPAAVRCLRAASMAAGVESNLAVPVTNRSRMPTAASVLSCSDRIPDR